MKKDVLIKRILEMLEAASEETIEQLYLIAVTLTG